MTQSTPRRRQRLMECQQGRCAYCGQPLDLAADSRSAATIDHRVPKSRGGTLDGDNAVLACRDCNELKGCLTADELADLLPQGPDAVRAARNALEREFSHAADRVRQGFATFADIWPKGDAA